MAEFCPTCAVKYGFEPETLEPGEVCENCQQSGPVRSTRWTPSQITIAVIFLLSMVIAAVRSNAQCKQWYGQPVDSVSSLVKKANELTGAAIVKKTDHLWMDSSRVYSFTYYEDDNSRMTAFELKAPHAEKVWEWLKSTVVSCIGESSDTYLMVGKNRFYYLPPSPFKQYGTVGFK